MFGRGALALDMLEEHARGLVEGVLGNEAALEGGLENGLAKLDGAREPSIAFRCDFIDDRKIPFNFLHDAALLGEGGNRERVAVNVSWANRWIENSENLV